VPDLLPVFELEGRNPWSQEVELVKRRNGLFTALPLIDGLAGCPLSADR
jgi:hypothetical protein